MTVEVRRIRAVSFSPSVIVVSIWVWSWAWRIPIRESMVIDGLVVALGTKGEDRAEVENKRTKAG